MPPTLRTFIQLAHFEPISRPGPNDWLANHAEPFQTFDDFRRSRPNRPDASRRTMYLQPLDDFPASGPPVPTLKEFTEAFFAMRVRVQPMLQHLFLPTRPLTLEINLQYRRNPPRCQRTTASGFTSMRDCFQAPQKRRANTQKILSTAPIGQLLPESEIFQKQASLRLQAAGEQAQQ
jgi:hypothetical protein